MPQCRKPKPTVWRDDDEDDERIDPDPLDPWSGEDHSREDLERVKEVIHSG